MEHMPSDFHVCIICRINNTIHHGKRANYEKNTADYFQTIELITVHKKKLTNVSVRPPSHKNLNINQLLALRQ